MKELKKSVDVRAPAEQVYAFLTQPANLPKVWPSLIEVSNITRAEDGSHSFDWTYKMGGLKFHGTSRTTEVEPSRRIVSRNEGGIPSTFRWSLEPRGDGTRVLCEVVYEIPTILGKIAEAVLQKANERELELMMSNTKTHLEELARPQPAATA